MDPPYTSIGQPIGRAGAALAEPSEAPAGDVRVFATIGTPHKQEFRAEAGVDQNLLHNAVQHANLQEGPDNPKQKRVGALGNPVETLIEKLSNSTNSIATSSAKLLSKLIEPGNPLKDNIRAHAAKFGIFSNLLSLVSDLFLKNKFPLIAKLAGLGGELGSRTYIGTTGIFRAIHGLLNGRLVAGLANLGDWLVSIAPSFLVPRELRYFLRGIFSVGPRNFESYSLALAGAPPNPQYTDMSTYFKQMLTGSMEVFKKFKNNPLGAFKEEGVMGWLSATLTMIATAFGSKFGRAVAGGLVDGERLGPHVWEKGKDQTAISGGGFGAEGFLDIVVHNKFIPIPERLKTILVTLRELSSLTAAGATAVATESGEDSQHYVNPKGSLPPPWKDFPRFIARTFAALKKLLFNHSAASSTLANAEQIIEDAQWKDFEQDVLAAATEAKAAEAQQQATAVSRPSVVSGVYYEPVYGVRGSGAGVKDEYAVGNNRTVATRVESSKHIGNFREAQTDATSAATALLNNTNARTQLGNTSARAQLGNTDQFNTFSTSAKDDYSDKISIDRRAA